MLSSTLPFIFLSSLLALVSAHGTMVAITGANGITGIGFGVDPTTPRTGSSRNPFQRDTSIIRDRAIARGQTGACGRTAAGNVDVVAEMAKCAFDLVLLWSKDVQLTLARLQHSLLEFQLLLRTAWFR